MKKTFTVEYQKAFGAGAHPESKSFNDIKEAQWFERAMKRSNFITKLLLLPMHAFPAHIPHRAGIDLGGLVTEAGMKQLFIAVGIWMSYKNLQKSYIFH